MFTPNCSYWITASGPAASLGEARVALLMVDTIHNFFEETEWPQTKSGKSILQYGVKDNLGTISQWTDLETDMAKVAAAVPEATFSVEEIDEETHEFHRTLTYSGGKLFETLYGRTIDPGKLDNVTIKACIAKLEEAGIPDACKYLEELIEK